MTLYTKHVDNENDAYATKPELWRPLSKAVGGFDVDVASGAESEHIAPKQYTKEDDGLTQQWVGKVWLNPPFSNKMEWFRKAVNEVQAGNADTVVALAPVDTSTEWFQRWFSKADVICWLEGRDWYVSSGSPSFNTAVGVFGEVNDDMLSVLDSKGIVTQTTETTTQATL